MSKLSLRCSRFLAAAKTLSILPESQASCHVPSPSMCVDMKFELLKVRDHRAQVVMILWLY